MQVSKSLITMVAIDLIDSGSTASLENVQRASLHTAADNLNDRQFAAFAASVKREMVAVLQERIDTARVLGR